ncbi:heterokaryon incompatibility protein-domain-containing protein [Pyrenochaeta sp. MPI-SDFR-AT-0127]|nr:heterokaryon incompatibility protein-domain-containing protein [Pyrenochaeta sp. MPI-SDFR-AT-0127]
MPASNEYDDRYGAGRQPYRYSDGRYLTANESRERHDRRASGHWIRRRQSLHRGYHSDTETRQQDSQETLPKVERRSRHSKESALSTQRRPGEHSLYLERPPQSRPIETWPVKTVEHSRYTQSRVFERRKSLPVVVSVPFPLGEHSHSYPEIPPVSDQERRSKFDGSTRFQDDERHTYHTKVVEPQKPSRSTYLEAADLSRDHLQSITRAASGRSIPSRPGEHDFHPDNFSIETNMRTMQKEHVFSHGYIASLPRITQRAPTWEASEVLPERPKSAPRPDNFSAEESTNQRRKSYGGTPSVSFSEVSTDHVPNPRSSSETENDRSGMPHSAMLHSDSRSDAGKPFDEEQFWYPTASNHSSAHMSRASSTISAASGVLGSKVYPYKPLERQMQFRLVKILPERTSKLKCEILHASLEHPPSYVAISYAWGDGVDTRRLVMGGVTISVAASLHGALKAVRQKAHEILVWVDGLSIDQQNKEERASQVQLMGYIYSRATFVAVWLGPDADDSQLAITLLEEVDKGSVSRQRIRDTRNPDSAALRSLFKRDYWNRLWVVQEVFLAQETWVYCGSSRLPWAAYKEASSAFWEDESDPHLRQGPSSFPDMSSLGGSDADFLLEVLRACRKKLSENPRDKIFGMLGMLPEETRKDLPADYDQSVKALYIDVADLIISSTRRLDVIREAIHFPLHVSTAGLPSWCPEWSHIPEISALREQTFSAAGGTDARYEFHDNERKLEFSAIELGAIKVTGVAVGTLCALQDYLMAFLHWRALLLGTIDLDDEIDDSPILEAFCRTLSLGQVPQEWEQRGWLSPCFHVFTSLIQKRLPRLPIDVGLQQYADTAVIHPDDRRTFLQKNFGDRMMGRTFCMMENGLMGMGSGFMGKGDIVVVPYGCSTPILLRAEGSRGEYRYVGDVYIHDFMNGEAFSTDKPVRKYMLH